MRKRFFVTLVLFVYPGWLWADTRMVFRESAWGGTRKDTLVVWQTNLLHLNTMRINRSYARRDHPFADTVEFIPNYTDSIYYLLTNFDVYFARSLSADSAFRARRGVLRLTGGTLQEKTLTDRRRIADTTAVHRQWVWTGCLLDSTGRVAGEADLEFDFWLPKGGFTGAADIEFYDQFRSKNFRGQRRFEGIEAGRISSLLGVWLVEFEKKAAAAKIFPLEMKLTLKRKLAKGVKDYVYYRQAVQLSAEPRNAIEFKVPSGFKRISPPEAGRPAKKRRR